MSQRSVIRVTKENRNCSVTICGGNCVITSNNCVITSSNAWIEVHQDVGALLGVCYLIANAHHECTTLGQKIALYLMGAPCAFLVGALLGNIVACTSYISYPLGAYMVYQHHRQK